MPIEWGNTNIGAEFRQLNSNDNDIPQSDGSHILHKSDKRYLRVTERLMSMMAALTEPSEPHVIIGYMEGFQMGLELAVRNPAAAAEMFEDMKSETLRLIVEQHPGAEESTHGAEEAMTQWVQTILRVGGWEEGDEAEFIGDDDPRFFR